MSGYLHDPAATADVMREGWLHTGDVGTVDRRGRLTVVDRSKDSILRGGHSVYPFEVENAIASHPGVTDVAVVGVADSYYGEEIVAVIVARDEVSQSDLNRWARERLAPHKVPRAYAIVDALPQGASGKTLKRMLRESLGRGEIVPLSVRRDG